MQLNSKYLRYVGDKEGPLKKIFVCYESPESVTHALKLTGMQWKKWDDTLRVKKVDERILTKYVPGFDEDVEDLQTVLLEVVNRRDKVGFHNFVHSC